MTSLPATPNLFMYGRDDEKARLMVRLLHAERRLALVVGASGIGKSTLLQSIREDAAFHEHERLYFRVTSPATKSAEMLEALSAPLSTSDSFNEGIVGKYLTNLAARPMRHARKLGLALITDFINKKLGDAQETAKALAEIGVEASEYTSIDERYEILAAAASDDLILAFRDLVNVVDENGQPGIIIIDNVEDASKDLRSTLKALCSAIPAAWSLVMAINHERAPGMAVFHEINEFLSYRGGEVIHLGPLAETDLQAWMVNFNPAHRDSAEIPAALATCSGRPYYLEQWLRGVPLEEISIQMGQKLAPAYRQRFGNLSPPARELLARCCVSPPQFLGQPDALEILSSNITNANPSGDLFDIEQAGLASTSADGTIAVHEETRQQILNILGAASRRKVAGELLGLFEPLKSHREFSRFDILLLQDAAGRTERVAADARLIGAELLAVSPQAAARAFELAHSKMGRTGTSDEQAVSLVGHANALIAMGSYEDGLSRANEAVSFTQSSDVIKDINIARLTALLRLNRYDEALALANAVDNTIRKDDPERYIEFNRILNTIQRDRGDYGEAVAGARELAAFAKNQSVEPRLLSRVFRTVSRSLAPAGKAREAVEVAQQAIEQAEGASSPRDIGNARLALGEAYRYARAQENAIANYGEALTLAKAVGNTDCLLWSLLGCADSYLLLGDSSAAGEKLDELKPFMANDGEKRHPLEYRHWHFSCLTVAHAKGEATLAELRNAAKEYDRYSIQWPHKYVDGIEAGEDQKPKTF